MCDELKKTNRLQTDWAQKSEKTHTSIQKGDNSVLIRYKNEH